MNHEGWPSWATWLLSLGALVLIVAGVLQIIQSRHDEWILGIISVVSGALFFIGLQIWPRWANDPS